MFREELDFFVANQRSLVEQYRGKVLVIKGKNVIGVYSTPLEAVTNTERVHPIGSFMIQPCEPGPEAYTVTINSHSLFR